jgi:hypothetical protein
VCRWQANGKSGRGDRIRTCDILLPKQARYRAALLPDDRTRALDSARVQVHPARTADKEKGGLPYKEDRPFRFGQRPEGL